MKLSVIIPAYNEVDTIRDAISRVQELSIDKEIIVVDDCSTDGTRELLGTIPGITLVLQPRNMGKGMAIRAALDRVSGDVAIIQDADLEYDPMDFYAIMDHFERRGAQAVYGSRFMERRPSMRPANYIANRILALAVRVLFGFRLTDEATCYKAIKTSLLREMGLTCMRFEFCPEVTAKLLRRGIPIVETPVSYCPRTVAQGKKINWQDGFVALWTLIRFRFSR